MNVWGDSVGCGVVEALTKDQLRKMDEEEAQEHHRGVAHTPNGNVSDDKINTRVSGYGHHNPVYMTDNDNTTL